ncbi:MAG TPA: hypothetical protein PLD14_01450 [Candidatus Pacearchaeota archaeon]|nr:hypothetical protein [Candidatus Pacearchaeota archaeon]HPR79865.1 hypothetical protein [Candidatus Pacearchaeota archaeon]
MKIRVPYTFNLLIPILGWSLLCGAFAYVLITTIVNFKNPIAGRSFLIMAPIYMALFCFLAILRYGGSNFLTEDNVRLINKNVNSKGIVPGLSTEEIKDTLNALIFVSKTSSINVLANGLSIMVLVILTEWFNLASNLELLMIFCGGLIALFFSCAFAAFFCQQFISPAVKECRRILMEREDRPDETKFFGIGSKFYFLFFLPLFTVLIVLISVYPFSINVAIICFIGLSMTFIIDRVLFVYLSNALKELEAFAVDLPMGEERAVFITGSMDKEIVDLSRSLNGASEKMYSSRSELEKSQKEMVNRVNELEKFFELTVNREVKMVELKKQLKKEKGDVQEDND